MESEKTETIWSNMIAARQLSVTYCTISTCLTDLLHRYYERISNTSTDQSLSLLNGLYRTLYASVSSPTDKLNHQAKLLAEYASILQTILQQNSLHTNIVQNVRRLFRSDTSLKNLFLTELNEHCQCQECDCTISNSITDVIHDVGEIRSNLLVDTSTTPCACFRCSDQSQQKTLSFQKFSPCLALTVNRLNINATDQLTNSQGTNYDLTYIIEFDAQSRSILSIYLREGREFIQVDGPNQSSRTTSIQADGKFLTLWLSRPAFSQVLQHDSTLLSPPQSASSQSIQSSSNMSTENAVTYQTTRPITSNVPESSDTPPDNDDDFWNSISQSTIEDVQQIENVIADADEVPMNQNDSVTDIYLTLLRSNAAKSSPIKSSSEHDRAVNALASSVLWPLILDQTNRRSSEKKSSSSRTTTTPTRSISSVSSVDSSIRRRNPSFKQLSSTGKSRRAHPYTTA